MAIAIYLLEQGARLPDLQRAERIVDRWRHAPILGQWRAYLRQQHPRPRQPWDGERSPEEHLVKDPRLSQIMNPAEENR